jgi:type VI secretion system protein ImpK
MKADEPNYLHDAEPTLMMPAPGGQATVVMKRPAAARKTLPSAALELQRMVAGINPLVGAAGTLLAIVEQLRSTTSHKDPATLRQQLLVAIADFETQATAGGVPRPKITAARYLLCSFLDESIAQTPWGSGGDWAKRNLLQEFHEERWGGEKAFQLLERLGQEPEANADLLELFYICLRLGFEGRFRGTPNGRNQLDAIAARMLEVIRPARTETSARTLAPHWQGVVAPSQRDVAVLPLWILMALTAALVLGIFLAVNARLDELTRPVFRQIVALPAALRLERSEAAAQRRLAPLLQADVARGALQVRDEALRSVVTLAADALFVPGSARIDARQLDLLDRLSKALKGAPGQIAVIGHTDDVAVSSPQFPSQWHLSNGRAQAVLAALAQGGIEADRLRAEGRADAEPLLPNNSDAARARNRRIEIELRLLRPSGATP